MAYPDYVITRAVTAGAAYILETGEQATATLTVTASRSLIHEDGARFQHDLVVDTGTEVSIDLPVTDMPGWRDATTGDRIDVSAPGSYTHQYKAQLVVRKAGQVIAQVIYGPFVVPTGADPIDLDLLVPVGTVPGKQVFVPDTWSNLVPRAEGAATRAEDAAASSEDSATRAATSAASGSGSASAAQASATAASGSASVANTAAGAASGHATLAQESAQAAGTSAEAAHTDMTSAASSAEAAGLSEQAAGISAAAAAQARLEAAGFATSASDSQVAAAASAQAAESERIAAETARTGAETARDLALAGQFAGTELGSVQHLDTVTTPGVYLQNAISSATLARGFPEQASGILTVTRTPSGYVLQTFDPVIGGANREHVTYRRRYTPTGSTAWTPWSVFTSQRVDQTAGRAIYTWDDVNNRDQLVHGDTGWRDISEYVSNGWAVNSLRIRRVNFTVHLAGYSLRGAGATANEIMAVDTGIVRGFRPSFVTAGFILDGGAPLRVMVQSTNLMSSERGSTGGSYFYASWPTGESWPTTLPGTAVGSIPNV